ALQLALEADSTVPEQVGVLALLMRVVRNGIERFRDPGEVVIDLGGRLRLAGDDQWRPRLVDQDRVDLVHDRVGVAALDDRDERLSFAGLHLGDVALMEDDPAHDLNVEGALAERALGGLANRGVGLEEQLLERLAVFVALFELVGLGGELLVGELLEVGLERRDVFRLRLQALEAPAFTEPEDFFEAAEILWHERFRVATQSAATRTSQRSASRR